jgi:hypothetical protein
VEYLDLLLRTFDIAKDAGMLPVILHQNNLRLMYEKWQHSLIASAPDHNTWRLCS